MKSTLYRWLLTFAFAICLSTSGFAWGHGGGGGWHGGGGGWHGGGGGWHGGGGGWHGGGGGWHGGGRGWGGGWGNGAFIGIGAASVLPGYYYDDPYYNNYGYSSCAWIRGHHNAYGYWIPAHKECWH